MKNPVIFVLFNGLTVIAIGAFIVKHWGSRSESP
jgi:hypothetical protein